MQGNGLLKITISCPEDMLEIEFYDTGHGFAPEMAETMFEPFFTTKEYGRGTGLGLAICRDIVEKYNGRIIAENAPQGGGVFTVCLPLKEKPRE
jgi:signal transduction histidine kinase